MKEEILASLIEKHGITIEENFDGAVIGVGQVNVNLVDNTAYINDGEEIFKEIDYQYLEKLSPVFAKFNECTGCYGTGHFEDYIGDVTIDVECDCDEKPFKY